jgi:hypothetical protein
MPARALPRSHMTARYVRFDLSMPVNVPMAEHARVRSTVKTAEPRSDAAPHLALPPARIRTVRLFQPRRPVECVRSLPAKTSQEGAISFLDAQRFFGWVLLCPS